MSEQKFSYDEVPYSSFTFPQTRPDRLATLGSFHGMNPAPPEKCRVLELGCGDGTNLLSFAYILPESEFVGVDLSKVHIDLANQSRSDLGLNNLEFLCEDVMKFDRERFGEFDYIIAHGLFSWVPDFVRKKILEIYAECLAPHGIGYISYNAYPGCKMREILWDMMKFYTEGVEDPMKRVEGGIQYANFINYAAEKDTSYQTVINRELSMYSQRTVENIFHDDFSSANRPFYFHEFAGMLKPHGLQFLCEVDAFWTESVMRPEIAEKLDQLGDDVIKREQYIDFIKGRPFRSTLVCRDSTTLNRHPGPEILRSFYLASQLAPLAEQPDLRSASAEKFQTLEGDVIEISHPLTKAAVFYLQSIWSRSAEYDEVFEAAAGLAGGAGAEEKGTAAAELLDLFRHGYVYFHRFRPEFPSKPGERPSASRFVQWQIRKKCADTTSLSGMNLKPDGDLMRLLLLLCDGTRDRKALAEELTKRISFEDSKREESLRELPAMIDTRLNEFAQLGLLHS